MTDLEKEHARIKLEGVEALASINLKSGIAITFIVTAALGLFTLAFVGDYYSGIANDEACRADCAVEYGQDWGYRCEDGQACDCIGPNGDVRGLAQ